MGFLKAAILVTLVAVVIACFPSLLRKRLPNKGAGFAAPGWRKVADTFRQHLETGVERGAGLAVFYQGELVVEFSGGYADEEAEWTWERTTLTHLFSSGKGVAAVVMAVLVDRGLLDYDRPVSAYWPEFGQNGKDFITVEQLLSHQAGLAAIDEEFSAYDILENPEKVGEILARQKPNWKLGEGHGYHGITLGLYEDQLVRRVDPLHRDLAQFFMEEIAIPFGLDIFFGLPTEEFHRCARSYPFSVYSVEILFAKRYWEVILAALGDPTSLTWRSMSNPPEYVRDGLSNHPHFKMVNNPATHGYATAISLGKFMGILASGGKHENKVLLSDKAIALLTEPLAEGKDKVLLMNITFGRGVTLRRTPMGGYMFGTPGAGGQMGYCDVGNKLGWAYLTNHQSIFAIGDDPRYLAIENAIYDTIKDLQNKQPKS